MNEIFSNCSFEDIGIFACPLEADRTLTCILEDGRHQVLQHYASFQLCFCGKGNLAVKIASLDSCSKYDLVPKSLSW